MRILGVLEMLVGSIRDVRDLERWILTIAHTYMYGTLDLAFRGWKKENIETLYFRGG